MKPILPPNQQLAAPGKWPIVGERSPRRDDSAWTITVDGLVSHIRTWALADLASMEQIEQLVDIHCVTRWSKLGARFGGVPLVNLLNMCRPLEGARFLSFQARSDRNHRTSIPLADALELNPLVALSYEREPLPAEHGGPVRMVVPGRYFYKSVKWLERIELLADDRLGYWEAEAGYHNGADPWREERYIVRQIDRAVLRRCLESRDFSGKDLLGIDARDRDLTGLDARSALLRNADFRGATLASARFDGANLSNARFERADLRESVFRDSDLEGAAFQGSDLRGADFRGASLFGATFAADPSEGAAASTIIDITTLIDEAGIDKLAPIQQEYVRESLQNH